MPEFPDPAGGRMTVANEAEARSRGWTPSMGSFGIHSYPNSGGGGGGGGGGGQQASPANAVQQAAAATDRQISALIQALSATNEQDFQEKIREFNQTHALALQQFGLTQESQRFQQQLQAGALTGVYQGQPTLAAQRQQAELTGMVGGQPTEQAREFNIGTQENLAKLSASLTGPADYFKYLTSLNQGRSIIGNLTGGPGGQQPMPQFGAPAQGVQPQNLQNILGNLGLGGTGGMSAAGASYVPPGGWGGINPKSGQQNPAGPSGGGMQALSAGSPGRTPQGSSGVSIPGFEQFGSLPFPHQVSLTNWNALGPTGQSFMKGAYAAAGYNPDDVERQIQATAPSTVGAPRPSSTTTNFAAPTSQSLFG